MSLAQMHHSICASCRIRSSIAAKQFARARVPLSTTSTRSFAFSNVRRLHESRRLRQSDHASHNDVVRDIEGQLLKLDKQLAADRLVDHAQHDFDLATPDLSLLRALEDEPDSVDFEWSPETSLTPEQVARHAREQFGDELPEDILDEHEYKAYERLFGPPARFTLAGVEEEVADYEEGELDEGRNVGTGILRENKDGVLEEVELIEDEDDLSSAEETGEGDVVFSKSTPELQGLDEQTFAQRELHAQLEKLRTDDAEDLDPDLEAMETDPDEHGYLRTHPLTTANRFSTPTSTVQLPKDTFVDPVSVLVSGMPTKHITEAAERLFGGVGLPYSTSTPHRSRVMAQKPIPLDAYQARMSDIEADVYAATIMPGVYASAYSIMIETRKRLGSSWLETLLTKEGGPRILDAGGAGAAVLAARQVLRAEWELMHDTSDDPEAVVDVAEPDGKIGGSPIPAPVGKATVLTGSDALRQRASALLDDTTFLPRLPDYLHASDELVRERGKFDIIFAPHTLWQIKEDYLRKQHIANLWSLLSNDGGVLILFEKGIPRGFELVAGAREMLLDNRISSPGKEDMNRDIYDASQEEDIYNASESPETIQWNKYPKEKGMIIAPCTNHSACPMYTKNSGVSKGRKDHCHFAQRFIRPPFLQTILGAKDRNHENVEFSYLSVMRGRDLRNSEEGGLIQGDPATEAAFAGYEDVDAALEASQVAHDQQQQNRELLDPTAPALADIDDVFAPMTLVNEFGEPDSLSLPRAILPPLKRHGHVVMDVCTPSGTLERWTISRSFSKQAYRDARKASWGDLWALGAKTRTAKNVRLGRGKEELGGVDQRKGAVSVKGKSKKTVDEGQRGSMKKGKGPPNVIDAGFDLHGNLKEEDIKVKNGGRLRTGKMKGIRDKRDKKGTGHGRRKQMDE